MNNSKYLPKPVAYLQATDFDNNGNLINPEIPKDIPVVVAIMANFCGYCTQAKPAFKQFADENKGKVFVATIQGDGQEEGESELQSKLNDFYPDFKGYPHYVLYKGGRQIPKQIKGRGVAELNEFIIE